MFVPNNNFDKKGALQKYSSIFTGEAVAICAALDWICLDPDRKYFIFSNSKGVLMAFSTGRSNRNLYIATIKNKLTTILKVSILDEPLKLVWDIQAFQTTAECGLEGNEVVDLKAKEATTLILPSGAIPYSDFNAIWSLEAREKTFNKNI